MQLTDEEIERYYQELRVIWEKNLKLKGVKLPRLKSGNKFTKESLVLIYLYVKLNQVVSKVELTSFIENYHPDTNDVQQGRHLAQQKGWYIVSYTRGDVEAIERDMKTGEYMLISLEESYPNFTNERRSCSLDDDGWEKLKKDYGYRCATCGSKEGEMNIHYPGTKTTLQKGHMDPNEKLNIENIIPQCEKCNRADRNYFVFNKKGRVIKIADSRFVLRSSEKVQKEMYNLLKDKYES